MKKVLQQTLFRLKTFLLLAVMFIVGSSAVWAQDALKVTFDLATYNGQDGWVDNSKTVDGFVCDRTGYSDYGINLWMASTQVKVTFPTGSKVSKIVVRGIAPYSTIKLTATSGVFGGDKADWTSTSDATWYNTSNAGNVTFSTTYGNDFYVRYLDVYVEESLNCIDFSYTSANGGDKGLYSINSDVLTFSAPVTVKKNLTIDGKNVTSATPDGNNLNVSFAEIDEPGVHTLTVPKGALQIGDDYNNEFSVNYILTLDPNKLFGTFFFSGVGLPYSRGGVDYNMASGYDFQVGDTFTANGVTFAFTNCPSGWFNNAQRFTVGQNTAFTIAAPEGYEITKIKFNTDDGQLKLNWVKGLTNVDDKNAVWVGNEESVGFSVLYDSKIQTVDVTCVKLAEVEYEVDIYKGTEFADDDWTVTVDGVVGTFKNMDTFTTGKKITAGDVVAPHHDGYHDAEVLIEEMAGMMFITVTYDVFEPINYTIDFSDNAPAGASVTIDGKEFTGDDTYSVGKDLDYNSVTAVDAPAGWYADYDYTESNHTFTFDFKQYINYSVVVEGAPAGQGGVVYNYNTYGAGENVLPAKSELTASSVSAASVAGLEGSVSLTDKTFTVTYTKPEYLVINTSVSSNNGTWSSDGVEIVGQGTPLNIWYYEWGSNWTATVSSNTFAIEKIEFIDRDGDTMFCDVNCGSFSNNIWTCEGGDYYSVTFDPNGGNDGNYNDGDYYITSVRVWLKKPVDPSTLERFDYLKVNPAEGEVAELSRYLTVYAGDFDWVNMIGEGETFTNTINTGAGDDLPAGVTFTDANSNSYTISNFYLGGQQINITLENNITTPGMYTLHIPAALGVTESNKTNDEWTFTWTIAEPTTYTVTFADGAPAGASVTIDGNTYTESTTFPSKRELDENSANVKDVEGYEAHVAYDESNKEFTITYTALPEIPYSIDITPADDENLKIRINGKEYAKGTHVFYEELTEESIEAPEYAGYYANPSVTLDNAEYRITVVYTAFPTLAIGVNASDNEGNYWTSFSFEKPFSLPEGVTPCIVTGAENGVLTVQEFETVNNETHTMLDFNAGEVMFNGGRLISYDGNNGVDITMTGGKVESTTLQKECTLAFSSATPIKSIKVTPYGAAKGLVGFGYGAVCSLNGGSSIRVEDAPYTFNVNANNCTLSFANSNCGDVYVSYIEIITGESFIPVIPANTGILVKADEAKANIVYTIHEEDVETVDVTANILSASGNGFNVKNDANNLYYKLTLNAASEAGSAGFYWDKNSDEGHSINVPAHKAYLRLPVSAGSNRAVYHFGGEDVLTGVESISTEADNAPVYNLQGQRVNATKAGVYVKNGKKFIVK